MIPAKQRNNSIDIFRYICAVLVVIIHTEPFYTGELSGLGIFLKQFLARIAVPFFFVVSGYFFFNKAFIGKASLSSVWKQVKTYLFWSVPYFLVNIWVLSDEGVGVFELVKKIVIDFFFLGSYYHFWFFPALIYASLISYAIYKSIGFRALLIISIPLYIFGLLGTTYAQLLSDVPVLSDIFGFQYFAGLYRILMTGFPFYVLGGVVVKLKEIIVFKKRINEILVLIGVCFAFMVEKVILLFCNLPIYDPNTLMLYPLVALVVILLLNHPLYGYERISVNARLCANFIYYVHPAFLLITDRVVVAVLGKSLHSVLMCVITVIILTGVGLLISKVGFIKKFLI